MNKSKLNWLIALFVLLLLILVFCIEIGGVAAIDDFDSKGKTAIVVTLEVFFFGMFFGFYRRDFFETNFDEFFFIPFFTFAFTSTFYFLQSNVLITYVVWANWILSITWAHYDYEIFENRKKSNGTNVFTFVIVLWITGFSFVGFGKLHALGFHFAENIYSQVSFFRWVLNIKTVLTILLVGTTFIRPFFLMSWKIVIENESEMKRDVPLNANIVIVIIDAIGDGIKKAGDYLNRIRLNMRTLIARYGNELRLTLKEVSKKTYSIGLMTICLISFLLLSRISDASSSPLYFLIKSNLISEQFYTFPSVFLYVILLYFLFVLNRFLFSIAFEIKSLNQIKESIWEVITTNSEILLVNVPGMIFLIAISTWFVVVIYNLIINRPFTFPGIYILSCTFVIIIFTVYRKFFTVSGQKNT